MRDFIGQNEVLSATLGNFIKFLFSFANIFSVLFTQNLPAVFAGFRAAVGQSVDNIKIFLNDLVFAAEIAGQKLNLALSIKSETRDRIKQDIARLEGLRTTAAASAVSIGDAFNTAFQETIDAQKAASQPIEDINKNLEGTTKGLTTVKTGVKEVTSAVKEQQKEVETLNKLQLDGVGLLQRKKLEAFELDAEMEKKAIDKKLANIGKEANVKLESDRVTREAIAANEEAKRQ